MGHPVTWFQIMGKDGAALQEFYRNVFAWKMSPAPDGSMMMVAPDQDRMGTGMAGGIGPSMDGSSNVTVYVNCADLEQQLGVVEQHGGRKALDPMTLPNDMGAIAGFIDPAGNFVGLWMPGQGMQPPEAPRKQAARRAAKKKPAKKAAKKVAKKAGKKAAKKSKKR